MSHNAHTTVVIVQCTEMIGNMENHITTRDNDRSVRRYHFITFPCSYRQAWQFYAESQLAKVEEAAAGATADWKQLEAKLTPEELTKAVKVEEEKFKMHGLVAEGLRRVFGGFICMKTSAIKTTSARTPRSCSIYLPVHALIYFAYYHNRVYNLLETSHNAFALADKELAADDNSKKSADGLIEASKDVLAMWLNKQVRIL
ncbi:hypothetical protein BC938DRAFT_471870 [Jimgerdemannia flammicorona]|uniref:Uncharacterized protein n=1 Tax=Jimgerdemannia flammicorona TaxID=994334 RepID=A0A433Q756_9FUNG|nr:hypothetical protein BC938DRAFT_471870 [Jimgerdemannia flammicorona]